MGRARHNFRRLLGEILTAGLWAVLLAVALEAVVFGIAVGAGLAAGLSAGMGAGLTAGLLTFAIGQAAAAWVMESQFLRGNRPNPELESDQEALDALRRELESPPNPPGLP